MAQRKLSRHSTYSDAGPARKANVALSGPDTMAVASPAHELQRLLQERVSAEASAEKYPLALRLMLPIIFCSMFWAGVVIAIQRW